MEGSQDESAAKPRRYDVEELKYLKDSPYVVKPASLPPAEQWMGPPADTARNSTKATDRNKNHETHSLLDGTPRRPVAERHISRNSANPEDIILGPPKTSFLSATPFKNTSRNFDSPDRPPLRDADSRDRFNFRTKIEGDGERTREGRNNLRPKRADGDQDSEGWSTVKPRKSFGTEGAERFNGRMGLDRTHKDERYKDREDRDVKERRRGFDTFTRESKDGEHEQDREVRKNGTRGRNEPTWFRDKENTDAPPPPRDRNSNGDRFADRSRGWREKDRDDKIERGDRGDRRWDRDRDQRQERDPEWMDEPAEEKVDKNKAHSLEEFQKWKDSMAKRDKPEKVTVEEPVAKPEASFFGLDKKTFTPLDINTGPDKFFGKWATPKDEVPPELGLETNKENVAKPQALGKASRFTSFFGNDAQRRQAEQPSAAPPVQSVEASKPAAQQDDKLAFAALLQKLNMSASGSTPPANPSQQPNPPITERPQTSGPSLDLFQQFRPDRQEEPRPVLRTSQTLQDLQNQRQLAGSQPLGRPESTEQLLQDLVGQRQNLTSQSSVRPGQLPRRDTQTDFLMGLMKAAPEPQRSEQVLLGMPPKQNDRQLQQLLEQREREQEMQRAAAIQRERSASQRQARPHPHPPPGFFDDPAFQRGPMPHERQPQPTQILARPPPPPGLDLAGWERQVQQQQQQQQLPPQHRAPQNIGPPPGLANGPNRMQMPQMYQQYPGMPGFAPPDVMAGPPRNMQMPPPGFYNAPPPPGFMPPGMNGFQGPEGMFGAPFDGRGPPPQGFRR